MSKPQFNRDDELTGRTRLVQEFDIFRSGAERKAKRAQWWMQFLGGTIIGTAAGIVVLIFKVATFAANVGHKDVEDDLRLRMAVYEKGQQDIAEQMKEIARAVHAPVLPTPKLEQPAILKEAR